MSKIFAAVAGLAALVAAGTAGAADLPRKAPPPVVAPVPYIWNGIYFGVQGGGMWNDTDGVNYNSVAGTFWHTDSITSGLIGAHVGANYQFSGMFVLGVEAGWNGAVNSNYSTLAGAAVGSSAPCSPGVAFSCQSRINDIGYVGGKLGLTFDRFMVYGTGGYANAGIETAYLTNATGVTGFAAQARHSGWYAGAGLDYLLYNNFIIGVDYKHYDFDSANHDVATGATANRSVSATADAVTGRLSVKFNPW